MRRLVIGLLMAGFAVGACNRAPDATTKAEPAQAETAIATSGAGEAAQDKASRETAVKAKTAVREVTIPAGTELPIVLDTSVGSKTSRAEEPVRAHLSRVVSVDGQPVLAVGSSVSGVVTDATPAGRVKGRAHLAVRFDSITPRGQDERYAVKIGAPAAGGAIIGAILGGGKGAAIGAAAGGGAGTAVVLSTRGKETSLPVGSALRLRLTAPLTVRIRS